jgi:hypothetical protein
VKSVFNIFLALFSGLLLFDGTAFAQQIQSMKLLTPQVGWAQSGQHLYWTTDGGSHWKDITPHTPSKENIADALFLDTSMGWVHSCPVGARTPRGRNLTLHPPPTEGTTGGSSISVFRT